MSARFRLRGAREMDAKLAAAEKLADRGPIMAAAVAGAEVIRDEARVLAPERRGVLRSSIIVSDAATNATWSKSRFARVFVGPDKSGWYAHFVEFGTVKMPAEPFMRPAFDHKRGEAWAASANSLRAELKTLIR